MFKSKMKNVKMKNDRRMKMTEWNLANLHKDQMQQNTK